MVDQKDVLSYLVVLIYRHTYTYCTYLYIFPTLVGNVE